MLNEVHTPSQDGVAETTFISEGARSTSKRRIMTFDDDDDEEYEPGRLAEKKVDTAAPGDVVMVSLDGSLAYRSA